MLLQNESRWLVYKSSSFDSNMQRNRISLTPWAPPMNSLVTIEEYDKSFQAQVAVLALEQAGIPCCLQNETLVSMDWFLANAVGGIKLQVAVSDAERAYRILDEIRDVRRRHELANKEIWVAFRCGRCKVPVAFSGASLGRVESCPKCGKYIDVPQESDNTLTLDLIEQTIHKGKEGTKFFSGSFSKQAYFMGEVFLVLCFAYFLDLYNAANNYLYFLSNGDDQQNSDQGVFSDYDVSWLMSRSLLVVACMAPVLFLNGLKRNETVDAKRLWYLPLMAGALLGTTTFCIGFLLSGLQSDPQLNMATTRHWAGGVVTRFFSLFTGVIANSIAEELVMRAYMIDRFEKLFGNIWVAVIVPALLFGSYHIYLGLITGFLSATLTGIVYGIYFARYRKLFPIIVAHSIHNLLCIFFF